MPHSPLPQGISKAFKKDFLDSEKISSEAKNLTLDAFKPLQNKTAVVNNILKTF